MNWDTALPAILTKVEANADVQSVLGDPPALYMAGEREFEVNSCEWQIISDTELELFNPILTQWDLWCRTMDELVTLEKALRSELHHDLPVMFGAVGMWSELVGARVLPGAGGAGEGIHNRSLDFRFTPVRG